MTQFKSFITSKFVGGGGGGGGGGEGEESRFFFHARDFPSDIMEAGWPSG